MSIPERRRSARRAPHARDPAAQLRLRTGRQLNVVNIGPTGALVESDGRLLPGTHVEVHVMTVDGRQLVRSRVVRAFVSALSADGIVYRGALAFERHVEIAEPDLGITSQSETFLHQPFNREEHAAK